MKTKKLFVRIAAIIMTGVFLSTQIYPALAANQSFTQTDWFGGISTSTATNSSNRDGLNNPWNKYASSDSNIYTNSPGTVSVTPVSSALYGSPQAPYAPKPLIDHTYDDFTKSTVTMVRNINIINNNQEGTLQLNPSANDPFYSTLGHWSALPSNPHVPYRGSNIGSAFTIVKDNPNLGDYYVYALWSGSSSNTTFARWDVNAGKWEFLGNFEIMDAGTLKQISISPGSDMGTSLAYPGSGDYIYALRGSGTKEFYRYRMSTSLWERLPDFAQNVASGGAIVATSANPLKIFGIGGGWQPQVYMYDGASWNSFTTLSFNVTYGGGMVYPGGNYVYVFAGNWSGQCAKFHKYSGGLSSVAEAPYLLRYYTSMSYPGDGDYIYFAPNSSNSYNDNSEFLRLNITNDAWECSPRTSGSAKYTLSRMPLPPILGKGHFYYKDGPSPKICWLKPDMRLTRPFTYDLNTNKWDEPSSSITYLDMIREGSALIWDGNNYMYFIGTWGVFYRYSISDNQWELLPGPSGLQSNAPGSGCEFLPLYVPGQPGSGEQYPFSCQYSNGGSMAYYNGYIYLMAGAYGPARQAFARYNISTQQWQAIATPPRGVNYGGYITAARDPVSGKDYIYAFRGDMTSEFWRYEIPSADIDIGHWELFNIADSSWTSAVSTVVTGTPNSPWTGSPLTVYSGGCLIYPGAGEYLYATFTGGYVSSLNKYQRWFYRFSLRNNAWEMLNDIPSEASGGGIGLGSLLVYSSYDQSIYFIQRPWLYINDATPFTMVKYPLGDVANPNPTNTAWQKLDSRKPFLYLPVCAYVHDSTTDNDYLYALSYGQYGLYRYNIRTSAWDPPQIEYAGPEYGQAVLGPDKDTVYFITGAAGSRAIIWKYSISKQKWLDFIPADPQFIPYKNVSACYPGTDAAGNSNYIYILEGGYGPRLWRLNTGWDPGTGTYDKTKEAFEKLEDCVLAQNPIYFSYGSTLVGDGNNLYVVGGMGSPNFYKYKIYAPSGDPDPKGWYKLANLPSSAGWKGNEQTFVHINGFSYWINTINKTVYKYDGISWSASGFPPLSFNITEGANSVALSCSASIDGTDYLFLAVSDGDFYKCSKSMTSWQKLTSVPLFNTYGSTLFYPGSGDYLYAVPGGGWYPYMMRYSISKNVWDRPPALPAVSAGNMSMAALGDGDSIYYRPGDSTKFYKYSVSNNSWTSTSSGSPDASVDDSARMTGTGDAIYATKGGNAKIFRKYDTVSWTQGADLPDSLGYGSDICFKGNYIYALKGGSSNKVWRYSFNNIWETVNGSGLGNVSAGGRLCAGDGDHIYCVIGAGSTGFYRYHPDLSTGLNGTWESLEPIPSIIGFGYYSSTGIAGNSAVCYAGFGDNIYVIPSSTFTKCNIASRLLYRYSISETDPAKKWKELSPPPTAVSLGSDLVYPGSGNYMYATAGYGLYRTFERYLAFIEGEYVSDVKYVGNNKGFDKVSWISNGKGNIEVRVRTSESPSMDGAPKWGDCPRLTSGNVIGQGMVSSVTDTHKYIQYQVKMVTDDINSIPELYNVRIDYKICPNKQELISSVYNTEFKNNRIMKLSWAKSTPPGTDIRFQLQTSPDGSSWSDWYGPGPGDTQDFVDLYSAANANKFSYQQLNGPAVIEISNDGTNEGARLKKLYSDFAHTQEIVFDNTLGPSLQNAILTIEIPASNLDFWNDVTDQAGSDVRFADASGNTLKYNITANGAAFNYANRYAKIFVKVPSLPANAKTPIFLKYGKQGAVSESDPAYYGNTVVPYYFYTISENNTCPALGPDWPKRLTVSIDNRSGAVLRNYQIQVNLDASQEDFWNSCRSDGYDMRFIDSDNSTKLFYWRPSNAFNYMNKNASLRVNIPFIPAGEVKTIYLYYGYTGSGMPPDNSTFEGTMTKTYFNPAAPTSRDFPEAGPNVSAVQLSGATSYISVPDSGTFNPVDGLSVEAQLNLDVSNGGWYPGFAWRRQLTFTNSSAYSIDNGTVRFDIARESAMKADYSDLRFLDSGGNKLKYYIISYDSGKANIYLNLSLASSASKTVYMYYGNNNALSESDTSLANGLSSPVLLFSRLYSNTTGIYPSGPNNNNYTPANINLSGPLLIFASVEKGPTSNYNYSNWDDMEISQGGIVVWKAGDDPLLETGSTRQFYQSLKTFPSGSYTINWHSNASAVQDGKDKTASGLRNYAGKYGAEIFSMYFMITPTFAAPEAQDPALSQPIISKGGSYELKFTKDGLTAVVNSTPVSTVNYDYGVGKFIGIAMTYDRSNIKLFVNGVEKAKVSLTSPVSVNTSDVIIGNGVKGAVDEIRIWNKARLPGEIYADKDKNIQGSASELAGAGMAMYLKCNEDSGSSCNDSTANGNNGTLINASWLTRPFPYSNEKPVALYHFDIFGGNPFNDSSGNGNNTAVQYQISSNTFDLMSPGVSPDKFTGYSVNFKNAAYMTVSDSASLDITKGLSIECWVRPQDPSIVNKQVILAKGDDSAAVKTCNYMLYCASGEIGLSYIDSGGVQRTYQTAGANFQQNPTAHVVATLDELSRMVNIYINGVSKYSGQMSGGDLSANNTPLYIGKSAASVTSPTGNQTAYYAGDLDELRIYNRALPLQEILAHYGYYTYTVTVPVNFYYYDPTVLNPALGAYPTNNPVIQPNIGMFYNTTNKIVKYGFTDSTVTPPGTAIKYQISSDGYNWYWFGTDTSDSVDGNTTKWRKAYGAYTSGQVNTAKEIGDNIDLFQTQIAPEGEFSYRAYLHAENQAFNTPILKEVRIRLNTGVETFYTDNTGASGININHTDARADQYFRYKAILYSAGKDTPQLNDVIIEYVNASMNITSPAATVYGLGQNLPITYYAEAVPSEKATIRYNTYNSDNSLLYSRTISTGASASNGTHTINWPVDVSDKNLVAPRCKIELVSEDSYNTIDSFSSMFTVAALQVTEPVSSNIWEIGTVANPRPHTIAWNNFGLYSANGDILTIQYSLDNGATWATSDYIATNIAPEGLSYEWDNTWSGRNCSPTDNAMMRVFKPAVSQDPTTPGNLIGVSAPFALVPQPKITIQPFVKLEYKAGAPVAIAWQTNQSQFSSKVDIDYSTDGFQTTHQITPAGGTSIGTSAGKPNSPITGSYSWTPGQQDIFDNITIRVKEQGYPTLRDTKQSVEGASSQSISIVPPTITILSPTASDRWVLQDTKTIAWTTDGSVSSALLFEYSKDGSLWYPLLAGASTIPNDTAKTNNSYSWTIQEPPSGPGLTGGKAQIRLVDINKSTIIGISPQFEVLGQAKIEIIQPNGGENIILGTLYTIKWNTWGNVLAPGGADYYKIDIYYKIKDGDDADAANWLRIANQVPNTGALQWLVDSAIYSETTTGKIKISDRNNPAIYSISASTFNITHPEVGFDSPLSGDAWFAGGLYDLKWNTKGAVGTLAIEYFVDGASTSWSPVAFQSAITETSNTYDPVRHFYAKWRVPNYPDKTMQIRVSDTTRTEVTAAVTISLQKPAISITSPTTANATGANSWALGTDHSIKWTTTGGLVGALNGFKILFSKTGTFDANSPVLATVTDPALVNTDTERTIPFSWNVLTSQGIDPVSSTAHIKIVDTNDGTIFKVSDAFSISPPSINITAPVYASDIYMGQQYLITWYVTGNIQTAYPLRILYDRDIMDSVPPAEITPPGFNSNDPAIQDLGNGQKGYLWAVPSRQADYPNYTPGSSQLRIEGDYPSLLPAVSDQFAVKYPQITVVNPGTIISATDTVNIGWTTNNKGALTGPFLVEWATKNDFSNANTISADSLTSPIQWLVPVEAVSANVWLRVRDMEWLSGQIYKVEGISANSFAVLPEPSATITSPNINTSGPDNAWRLGNIVTISWTKNNSGAMSNNLENLSFYYALDALAATSPENWTWVPFTPTDYEYNEITGTRSVKWAIPVTLNPSANSAIRIYDNMPWRNVPEKHLFIVSDRFEIAIPRIVITSPKAGECWAYGEKPTITWYSDGAIDDNSLSIYFTATADISPSYTMISPTLKEPNSGTFTWSGGIPIGTRTSTPSNPNGQIRINATYGGNKQIAATSGKVTIIAQPAITVTQPGGGPSEEYEIGKDITIKWTSQGISVNSVKIEYSTDGFVSAANIKTIADSVPNIPNVGGEYKWTVPNNALVGRNMRVRISKADDLGIQGISPNDFRIKGGFDITSPNGGESWVAKSPQTISWTPRGSISKVKLQLSWDGGATWEEPFATNIDNTGSYSWNLPDIPAAEQTKVKDQAKIRISNQADDTEFDSSNANFSIVYATIVFYVLDYDGGQQLQDIIVQKENGTNWAETALASPIRREYAYPYGAYTTFFTKTDYIDNSVTWAAPKQQKAGDAWIINVTLENKALAQVTFESILTYSYTPSADILNAAGSLQRKGKIVGTTEDDRNKLGNATLTVYEPASQTVKYRLTASPPADRTGWNGMYYFAINAPTGFIGGQVYPATLAIEYGSETVEGVTTPRIYTSTANIEIGLQMQAEELSDKLDESTAQITSALDNSTSQIMVALGTTGTSITQQITETKQKITETQEQISQTKADISGAITAAKDEIKAETSAIRVATETTLPAQIQQKVETVLRSEILNRETVVRIGTTLTVRYRVPASANANPIIDIYDPNNKKVLLGQNIMTKSHDLAPNAMLPGMAVYNFGIKTGAGWAPGDYTIVCSDPASGTMDAMMISMLRTDLEDISSQVGTILGTTTSLSNLKEVADTLNSQFSIIESALGKIGSDLVNKAKEVASSATDMESVYGQLANISRELKNLGAGQDVNLGKLLEVSKEKKQDMIYLKNKTQELKAVMELNQKMIDNIAHKPVTQTWFEYK